MEAGRVVIFAVVATACGDDHSGGVTSSSNSGGSATMETEVVITFTQGSEEVAASTDEVDASSGSASSSTTVDPDSSSDSSGGGDVMSFFVTSAGNGGAGGNYGGLTGADARCQNMAEAAGSTGQTWRAYLSEAAPDVHARDRIGAGPWFNAAGNMIAPNVATLHDEGVDPTLMLDELGAAAGKGEPPGPEHDILTGSNEDGTLAGPNLTCANWTSNAPGDRAQVGHHDWSLIPNPISPNQNWNSVHDTPCDEAGAAASLGTLRLYCFAAD